MSFLRRARGALVLAGVWGLAWLPVGVVVGIVMDWVRVPFTHSSDWSFLGFWTLIGALSGGVFAALLSTAERRRTFAQLSSRRVAIWGILGGAAFPLLSSVVVLALTNLHFGRGAVPLFVTMAAWGGVCALSTLGIARRGEEAAMPSVTQPE